MASYIPTIHTTALATLSVPNRQRRQEIYLRESELTSAHKTHAVSYPRIVPVNFSTMKPFIVSGETGNGPWRPFK
jgi:hypothetical protein